MLFVFGGFAIGLGIATYKNWGDGLGRWFLLAFCLLNAAAAISTLVKDGGRCAFRMCQTSFDNDDNNWRR